MSEYRVPASPEAGSPVVEAAKDQYGLCVVCGRRVTHCLRCHRAHDYINFVEASGLNTQYRQQRHDLFLKRLAPQYDR